MIRGKNLTVELGGNPIISDVSIDVIPGEFVAVVGSNGAGKSTLLRALSGEVPVTRGTVELVGRPLADWPAVERALRLAVLPQSSSLSFGLSVQEIVALGCLPMAGRVSGEIQAKVVQDAMAKAEVEAFAERNYLTLSGGEKLRTHLARAMAQILEPIHADPRVLLLDEPTSSLDLRHQMRVLEIVREFTSSGVGILAILHDLNLASRFADRVFVMHQGRVVASGAPVDVFEPGLLRSAFGIEATLVHVEGISAPQVVVLDTDASARKHSSEGSPQPLSPNRRSL